MLKCNTKLYVIFVHTYIVINEDIGVHVVIHSDEEDLDIISAMDEMIIGELACYAEEGI